MIVSSLPKPIEIDNMPVDEIARQVLLLCDPSTLIHDQAALTVNEFLGHAALKLAKARLGAP